MFKVIHYFTDGQDGGHEYNVGDTYPRKNYTPTADRVRGLLGRNNKQGRPLIVKVDDVETADKKPEKVERPKRVKVTEKVETPEKDAKPKRSRKK